MHKIKIENLEIFGFHGVYRQEEEEGQIFYINIEYTPREDLKLMNDDINETTDYIKVISTFTQLFNKKRYSLIEILGRDLLNELIEIYNFINLKIIIRKKIILDINKVNYISIEIEKNNE